jgi:GGDEF domain-containing protein
MRAVPAPAPPPPPPPPPAPAASGRWAHGGRDPLTGLPDRPALRRALRAAAGAGLPASVVGLRVEGLRDLNRDRGEEAGDTALRDAASALRAAVVAVAGGPADGGPAGRLSGATVAALVVPQEAPAVLEALARAAPPGWRTAQVPVDQADPEATLRSLEDALH